MDHNTTHTPLFPNELDGDRSLRRNPRDNFLTFQAQNLTPDELLDSAIRFCEDNPNADQDTLLTAHALALWQRFQKIIPFECKDITPSRDLCIMFGNWFDNEIQMLMNQRLTTVHN